MVDLKSCLYQGQVMHHRFSPAKHRFVYRVFSCCIDLDELPWLDKFRLLSVNRFNLFSFHEKDYGQGRDKGSLAGYIRTLLLKRGYPNATHRIKLLCYPRILGYAFNPLSVYFCYNADDQLEVVLYEVSNTFGSRHTYLLPTGENADIVRHGCDKKLYVSPFMPMDTAYSFRIEPPSENVKVCIRQCGRSSANSQAILHATFTGSRSALDDLNLSKMLVKYPLMTLKVMAGIHWEALQLWRKKLKVQPRDKNRTFSISWQDKSGVSHHESL